MNLKFIYRFLGFLTMWSLLPAVLLHAQEVPEVQSFERSGKSFEQHCWSIAEDCEGRLYTATAAGVNVFNGFEWITATLPYNRIARCLYRGADCKVYVGGFETFGYIELTERGNATYHSVGDSFLRGTNEEIWQIVGDSERMMIQSFSMLLEYDYSTLKKLPLTRNIRLGEAIDNAFYYPDIDGNILLAGTNSIEEIYSHVSGQPLRISAISSSKSDRGLLIATERQGMFELNLSSGKDAVLKPIRSTDIDHISSKQINHIIRLRSGDYAIGTVLDGVYITDGQRSINFHINKQNGLSSNTVISFHEDAHGNLWIGTDGGVNAVRLGSPTRCFYDNAGFLGTVYSSERYRNTLFMSTNHGVFIQENDGKFSLLPNTQGQSWELFTFNDLLLCGHNNGTYAFDGTSVELISSVTGGWWMDQINDSTILQSTYTGLARLTRSQDGWEVNRLRDGNILIRKFILVGNRLLGYHSRYGLCLLQLDDNYSTVTSTTYLNNIANKPVDPSVGMFSSGDSLLLRWQDSLYIVEDFGLRPADLSELTDNNLRRTIVKYDLLVAAGESFALANMDHNELTSEDAFIFSRDYGYSFEPIRPIPFELSLEIDHVEIRGRREVPAELDNLGPGQQNIIIRLRKRGDLTVSNNLQYLLAPSDDTWLPVPTSGALSFQNLASESYTLHIRDGYGNRKELVTFSVPAPWHLSWPGGILYTSTVILTALVWNRSVRRRTAEKARLKHADEVRRLEAERIRQNNEQLQREVQLKSKLLANRAMALAQKNKLLLQMKNLAKAKPTSETASSEMRSRIIRMVDQHTDHEDEWKVFENNFDEVHEQFTERLLEAHPNLTAGDKRLASFIRMDLSSKEIAPLLRISVRSVENKRHRLRKKMRLESGQRLNEYLMRF